MKWNNLEHIKGFWNSNARWYESNMTQTTSKFYVSMLPFLHLDSNSTVLETACGTGNGLSLLLEAEPNLKLTGTDISEEMIDLAKAKLGDRAKLFVGDNENLSFVDRSFSHYISNLSLHIVPNPKQMMAEAYRVLKPGGLCALSVIGYECSYMNINMKATALASRTLDQVPSYLKMANHETVMNLISQAGFDQTLRFSEAFHYPIWDASIAADWLCADPSVDSLRTSDPSHFHAVKSKVQKHCEHLLNVEKVPLQFQADLYVTKKLSS